MSLKTNFHAHGKDDRVSAHGTSSAESFWVTGSRGECSVSIFFDLAKAREIHRQLGNAIAESDLIADAKAKAREAA